MGRLSQQTIISTASQRRPTTERSLSTARDTAPCATTRETALHPSPIIVLQDRVYIPTDGPRRSCISTRSGRLLGLKYSIHGSVICYCVAGPWPRRAKAAPPFPPPPYCKSLTNPACLRSPRSTYTLLWKVIIRGFHHGNLILALAGKILPRDPHPA
jgi:hypothetical protein